MAQNLARRESAAVIIERVQKRHVHRYADYVVTGGFGVRKSWLSYRCPRHGQVTQRASAHLQGQGCPDCKKSKMELAVCGFFIRKGIPFVKQKRFASCVAPDTRCKLAFDFYIPSHNLCIEVDGKQHEIAVKYFGGETAFQRRKVLDKIKTDFCHHSKIGLLRVKHTEAKNINKVLEDAMVGKAFNRRILGKILKGVGTCK
jgi:very-short-patch-repair endonuclease